MAGTCVNVRAMTHIPTQEFDGWPAEAFSKYSRCAVAHRRFRRRRGLSIAAYFGRVTPSLKELLMNRIVYIVGAVVIIVFLLGFLGLR